MNRNLLALTLAAPLAGCMPGVHLQVLRPADVALPAEIRTLAVIDRSAPSTTGEHILGTLEGIVTGEGILEDREGAAQAVAGAVQVIRDSPRFEVVPVALDPKKSESSIWDRELSWRTAKRIARENNADALVSLEAFDSDSSTDLSTRTEETTSSSGNPVTKVVHVARRETRVMAAWRIYDTEHEVLLDDLRDRWMTDTWTYEGATADEAMSQLPSKADTVLQLGWAAGETYGVRIAPTYVWVHRSYYGGGSPELKEAKRYVKADDWQGAAAIWSEMTSNPDRKIQGKATYNLALAMERGGDLQGALTMAKKAAVDLGNGRSRSYVSVLNARIAEQARLQEQMAPPPPEEPAGRTRPQTSGEGDARPAGESGGRTRPR